MSALFPNSAVVTVNALGVSGVSLFFFYRFSFLSMRTQTKQSSLQRSTTVIRPVSMNTALLSGQAANFRLLELIAMIFKTHCLEGR
jgi:hypothetical protein